MMRDDTRARVCVHVHVCDDATTLIKRIRRPIFEGGAMTLGRRDTEISGCVEEGVVAVRRMKPCGTAGGTKWTLHCTLHYTYYRLLV